MISSRSLCSSLLFALAVPALLIACSASGSGGAAPVDTAAAPTLPAPAPATDAGAGAPQDGGHDASDSAPPTPKNDCKLPELTDVADVTPSFIMYAAPKDVPKTMTGGTLLGSYRVDAATVFLPSGAAGLVDPRGSTGKVNAWAVFSGSNYRLHLTSDFTIASVAGPQMQSADSVSQGGFTVSGAALTLDHACDTAIAQEADYSFTDTGNGRATILIKTPSPYGDTYLELEAAKN
jgi:hypothetical protein